MAVYVALFDQNDDDDDHKSIEMNAPLKRDKKSKRDIIKNKRVKKKSLKTKMFKSVPLNKGDDGDKVADAAVIKPKAKRTMPSKGDDNHQDGDDDCKKEERVSNKTRKRRRVNKKSVRSMKKLFSSPIKKRRLNAEDNLGADYVPMYPDTPMPKLYTARQRRRTFSPIKTPKRRVRKNKNVRVKIAKKWYEGVVQDMDDEMVIIRYKAGENSEKKGKFIMKSIKLDLESKAFEMMNNRQLRCNRLMFD